jgi:hypothetical protein
LRFMHASHLKSPPPPSSLIHNPCIQNIISHSHAIPSVLAAKERLGQCRHVYPVGSASIRSFVSTFQVSRSFRLHRRLLLRSVLSVDLRGFLMSVRIVERVWACVCAFLGSNMNGGVGGFRGGFWEMEWISVGPPDRSYFKALGSG